MISPTLQEYETKVMTLPANDRAILAEHLIDSLDSLNDMENERIWIKEAERRYQDYKKGKISARSAAEAVRDARSIIK